MYFKKTLDFDVDGKRKGNRRAHGRQVKEVFNKIDLTKEDAPKRQVAERMAFGHQQMQ